MTFTTGDAKTAPVESDARQVGLELCCSSSPWIVVSGSRIIIGPERSDGWSAAVHVSSRSVLVLMLLVVGGRDSLSPSGVLVSLCLRFLDFLSPLKESGLTMARGFPRQYLICQVLVRCLYAKLISWLGDDWHELEEDARL